MCIDKPQFRKAVSIRVWDGQLPIRRDVHLHNKGLLNPYGGCIATRITVGRERERGREGEGERDSSPGVDRTASDFLMSSEPYG